MARARVGGGVLTVQPGSRGPRQGAGAKVEATADIQTGQSPGREVGNGPHILVLPYHTLGGSVEKHDIFLKRLGLCPETCLIPLNGPFAYTRNTRWVYIYTVFYVQGRFLGSSW